MMDNPVKEREAEDCIRDAKAYINDVLNGENALEPADVYLNELSDILAGYKVVKQVTKLVVEDAPGTYRDMNGRLCSSAHFEGLEGAGEE